MKSVRPILLAATVLSLLVAACSRPSEPSQPPNSGRPELEPQFGTRGYDDGYEMSAGSGGIYLYGRWNEGTKLFRFTHAGTFPWFQNVHPQCGYSASALLGLAQTSVGDAVALIGSRADVYGGENPTTYISYALRKVASSGKVP